MWSIREISEACDDIGIDVCCAVETVTYAVPRGDGTNELRFKQRPLHFSPFRVGQCVAIMAQVGKAYKHVASFRCVRAGRGEAASFEHRDAPNPLTRRMMIRRLEGAFSSDWGTGPEWVDCGKCG